ncbi:MAG: hypothetical protein DKM50_00170 [Candidatus Margulisiibacteriota bacterium]|nr:MAG: hypothetical protein A2X42_01725 [Candidatus Margulisbacteria bacterium GWF2_38_17]OGI09373.1 MAG: hypothetical protein A2X41_09650 [Candidatus Margulisbacteria bacterium GWE2_39_32]PZM84950.1 MAG: hypothetical protein DKM50_00170 [Candidatus Margulisiibacteriota bacterium]HCT86115.1 hypothetical protein [Candidatus Margulisiibacteriota bacterium]HCY36863.1 hypothetical protein [Candidatus Margulisiibacteriota bacterium]
MVFRKILRIVNNFFSVPKDYPSSQVVTEEDLRSITDLIRSYRYKLNIISYFKTQQSPDKHAEGPTVLYHIAYMLKIYELILHDQSWLTKRTPVDIQIQELINIYKDKTNEQIIKDFIIFHDIGKKKTMGYKNNSVINYGHTEESLRILNSISIQQDSLLYKSVKYHMTIYNGFFNRSNVRLIRKFIEQERMDLSEIKVMFALCILDYIGTLRNETEEDKLRMWRNMYRAIDGYFEHLEEQGKKKKY